LIAKSHRKITKKIIRENHMIFLIFVIFFGF